MPETYQEAIFTVSSIMIGIIMNATVIGSLGSALQNLDTEKQQRRQRIDKIVSYMKRRRLPTYFQRIILDFYDYMIEKSSDENVLHDLPSAIQVNAWHSIGLGIIP
jgi:hypothetical protein